MRSIVYRQHGVFRSWEMSRALSQSDLPRKHENLKLRFNVPSKSSGSLFKGRVNQRGVSPAFHAARSRVAGFKRVLHGASQMWLHGFRKICAERVYR